MAICLYGDADPGVGTVYHHATDAVVLRDQGAQRMVLSVDDAEALIGYFPELAEASAHWSRNIGFMQMAKDYIRHDIWMIKLLGRFSSAIDDAFGTDRLGCVRCSGPMRVPSWRKARSGSRSRRCAAERATLSVAAPSG